MSKPIGYFTSYTPGDNSFFDHFESRYGIKLEALTIREKLYLIQDLSRNLGMRAAGEIRPMTYHIAYDSIAQLNLGDQEGLIQGLIDQVREV